jgi:hypothetical protein
MPRRNHRRRGGERPHVAHEKKRPSAPTGTECRFTGRALRTQASGGWHGGPTGRLRAFEFNPHTGPPRAQAVCQLEVGWLRCSGGLGCQSLPPRRR